MINMIITDIQKRRGLLNALYIDGEYAVDIDREVLLINHVKIGLKLKDEDLYRLISESNNKRAKERALYYLSHRDYSKKELADKLKKTFGEDASLYAVNKMEDLNLMNDERFAEKYAHDLMFIKKYAPQRILRELLKRGIDKYVAEEIIDNLSPNTCEQIHSLVERKYQKYLIDEKGKRRTVQALMRLGYSWGDIKPVINEFLNQDY